MPNNFLIFEENLKEDIEPWKDEDKHNNNEILSSYPHENENDNSTKSFG